jgi:UDP-N-acetylmuramyl pentapeptide phosphotransferase/UDP-N-acetylglucosamine-1-phosphate transferase
MVSVACLAAIFSAFKLEAHGSLAALFCCYAALFLISWFDDFWSLSVRTRFSIHILVIFLWVYFNSSAIALLAPKYLFVPACLFLVIGLTWSINLFNFMDGSDGLAGSMCVIGLSAYLACIFLNPATGMVPVLSGLIGATAAFLLFNWPKASIFLGDSGSIPLGFLLGGIGVTGVLYEWWTAQFPLLVFAMFWVDATFTLLQRILSGQRFWQPHNQHWYQKAIRGGASHKKVLWIHIVCNVIIVVLALSLQNSRYKANLHTQAITILGVFSIVCAFGLWAESTFRHQSTDKKQ